MRVELTAQRTANAKHFDNGDGTFQFDSHCGHIHYFNKLGIGDGQMRWREIDWKLQWDDARRGWYFQFHSFQPFLPEYADGTVEFRDLYDGKDQTVKFVAQCAHIKGELIPKEKLQQEGLDRLTQQNCVIYRDAFGEGKDYILYFTRSTLSKVVRIRSAYKGTTDQSFDFQVEFPKKGTRFMKVRRMMARDVPDSAYELDLSAAKTFDTDKQLLIGNEQDNGKEWNTYLRRFTCWDSGKGSEFKRKTINVDFYQKNGKKYLRKIISGAFLQSSIGDVFTDTTTSYYAGSGDGYVGNSGSTWSTVRSATDGSGWFDYTTAFHDNQFQTYKTGSTYIIWRAFYPSDTSGIGSGNTVSAATLNVWCETKTPDTDSVSWHIVETSQASNTALANSDYDAFVNSGLGSRSVAGMTTGQYTAYTLTDITKINTTGYTKLGLISSLDLNDSAPTGANYWVSVFSEYTGTSNDPYYSITYEAAPTVSTIYLKGRPRNRYDFTGISAG